MVPLIVDKASEAQLIEWLRDLAARVPGRTTCLRVAHAWEQLFAEDDRNGVFAPVTRDEGRPVTEQREQYRFKRRYSGERMKGNAKMGMRTLQAGDGG